MLKSFLNKFKIKSTYSVYLYSIVVGILSGLFAILFVFLLTQLEAFIALLHRYNFNDDLATNSMHMKHNWASVLLVITLPAVGGLLTGYISHKFSSSSAGTGTDSLIDAFHNKEGKIDAKAPFYKSVATIFTLGSGGSGGKEGPIAYIGAGIGVIVANLTNAGARARRTLMLAGTAAGLGSVFKAPLGGALTAAEMVYKEDIESDALIPCFISSVTAYLIYTQFAGNEHFMSVPGAGLNHYMELVFYILLGALCYPYGYLFIQGFNYTKKHLLRIKIHPVLKPALGGLLVGMVSVFFFEVSGTGSGFLQAISSGTIPVFMGSGALKIGIAFLIIAFLKIVTTTLTIGTGGSAGIFGPSLFIGGMLGAGIGTLAQYFLPGYNIHVASYIVVGMGAFYAGVARAPIAGIVMICEMTGTYVLLPPLIIVSIFTFILSKKISIYKSQVENRFQSPAHFWDMKIDVIDSIKISEHFKEYRNIAVVKKDMNFIELRKLSSEIYASDFVIKDDHGNYFGMISLRKILLANEKFDDPSTTVETYADNAVPSLNNNSMLSDALTIIMQHDVDKAPVADGEKLLGYIRSRDIFDSYLDAVDKKHKN